MENVVLTKSYLLSLLGEQLYLLDSSISRFARYESITKYENKVIGKPFFTAALTEIEAKRIATVIRVLLHDTSNSTSLLKHLDIKDKIEFIGSASPNDGKLHSMTGMHGVRGNTPLQYFGLVAKVNENGAFLSVPLFKQHLPEWYGSYKKLDFQDWWDENIISVNGHNYSRKEIVLDMAHKDGGAHVDNMVPQKYYETKNTPLSLNIDGIKTNFERNIAYASVAQIGWELLNSIDEPINV